MRMKRGSTHLFLLFVLPAIALGLAGKTSSPSLSFPPDTAEETISKTLKFLNEEVAFIEGWFFNEFQGQTFHGDGASISKALNTLREAGLEITLKFAELADAEAAFQLNQGGRAETTMTINVAHPEFEWDQLEVRLPAASEVDLESD